MFYRRWWWATVIQSDEGFRVSPEGERGIKYWDETGDYFINAAYSHDGKYRNELYEFGASDIHPTSKGTDFQKEKRLQIFQRVRDAIIFSGTKFIELA